MLASLRSLLPRVSRGRNTACAFPRHPPPQVLVEKCLGRRLCRKCGKNYNVADIYLPATDDGRPEIVMPPLNPPPECMVWRAGRGDGWGWSD